MSDFDKKMRLKESAEEDIYFARRDRERISALHGEKSLGQAGEGTEKNERLPAELNEDGALQTSAKRATRGSITRWLRRIAGKVFKR